MKMILRLIFWTAFIALILTYMGEDLNTIKNVGNEFIQNKDNVPELEKYRTKIYNLSGGAVGYDKNIPVTWMSENLKKSLPNAVGVCYGVYPVLMEIGIDKRSWNLYNEKLRIILLAHELLHCEQNKDHTDTKLKDGCPAHIMNSYLPGYWCMSKHYNRYINQIKQQGE